MFSILLSPLQQYLLGLLYQTIDRVPHILEVRHRRDRASLRLHQLDSTDPHHSRTSHHKLFQHRSRMAAARGAIRRLATAVDASAVSPSTSSPSAATINTSRKWTRDQIQRIYEAPLMDLMFRAATVHRQHHDPNKIQLCTLLNIKWVLSCALYCSFAMLTLVFVMLTEPAVARRTARTALSQARTQQGSKQPSLWILNQF